MAFLLWLAASLKLGPIARIAGTRRMKLLAGDHSGVFVARADVDVLVAGLDVLVASLDVRNVFVGLDPLDAFIACLLYTSPSPRD